MDDSSLPIVNAYVSLARKKHRLEELDAVDLRLMDELGASFGIDLCDDERTVAEVENE